MALGVWRVARTLGCVVIGDYLARRKEFSMTVFVTLWEMPGEHPDRHS
jgi:hypothetical protein